MNDIRHTILNEISEERDRQFNLPGSERDQLHSFNDWVAIASKYLTRDAEVKHFAANVTNQRESLVKSAAVILAAIEHLDRKSKI